MSDRRQANLPSFSLGYHGCDRAVADRVISGRGQLRASRNDYDWLGEGIYFWEGDPTRAKRWAVELKRGGRINKPAVVGAIIDPGLCLNLLDRAYLKVTRAAYDELVTLSPEGARRLPTNSDLPGRTGLLLRRLDCAVINDCRQLRLGRPDPPPFDTVRAAFIEGEPLYPNAGFNDRNHIQLCVVNPACTQGHFRPLTGGAA